MEEKVTVLMAEYNTPLEQLKLSIESILKQTYKNFEFLIVDDCGNNNLSQLVQSYNDSRIRVIKNSSNKGLVYSLNLGIKESNAEFIIRMDTDDIAYTDRIEKQIKFAIAHPEYAMLGTNCEIFDGVNVFGKTKKSGEIKLEDLYNGSPFIHPTMLIRKEMLINLKGYPDFNRCEDYALWCNAYLNGYKGFIMDDITLKYRLDLAAYKKRGIKTRISSIKHRISFYKKADVPAFKYLNIIKLIIAGILPAQIMYKYHKKKFTIK